MKRLLSLFTLTVVASTLTACGGTTVVEEDFSSTSSTSSGVGSTSSGGSSSSNSSSSSTGAIWSFDDNTVPESLDSVIEQYKTIARLDVGDNPVSVGAPQVLALIQNGLRQKMWRDHYRYSVEQSASTSSNSSSSGSAFNEAFETVASTNTFNVASPGSAPLAPRLNDALKDDYWMVSDVSDNGQTLNFEVFQMDEVNGTLSKRLDYKAIGAKPRTYTSAMGFDFVDNADGSLGKLVLVTQEEPERDNSFESLRHLNTTISVHFVNIEDFATPDDKNTVSFSGNSLAQHRVKDTLYVFSQVRLGLLGLKYGGDSLADAITDNESIISGASLNSLLPGVTDDDVFFSLGGSNEKSVSSLLKITAIDLLSETIINNTFLAMPLEGIFLEGDSLYTWASPKLSDGDTTALAKYQFSDAGISVKATGLIDGVVTIANASRLRGLNVIDGVVRVVSTNANNHHNVLILEDNDAGQLEVVGSLAQSQLQAISTSHKVFNVVFSERKMLINTKGESLFQYLLHGTSGPTYVVDTSDLANPVVTSEIDTGDFANHLQMLGDHHLLAVRRSGPQLYSTEIELWDTEQPEAPIASQSFSAPEGSISSGGPIASSPANMSQSGVAVVKVAEGQYRAVVPVDYTGVENNVVYTRSELAFLEISGLSGSPVMALKGESASHSYSCQSEFNGGYGCIYSHLYGTRRTLLIDDSIFHMFEGDDLIGDSGLTSFQWGSFDTIVDQVMIN